MTGSAQFSRAPAIGLSAHMRPPPGSRRSSSPANPLLSAATDPADDDPSGNQLMAAAPPAPARSATPIIVPSAAPPDGGAMSRQAAQHLSRLNLAPEQVRSRQARSEYLVHALAELARRAGPVSTEEVTAVIMDAVAAGHLSPKEAGSLIASIPVDKAKLKTLVQQHHAGHVLAAIHLRGLPGGSSPRRGREG